MKRITIGRGSENSVKIDDDNVSRRHCQITQDNQGQYRIVDLNSKNGVYVNRKRISGEYYLNFNDTVRIGNIALPWQSYFEKTREKEKTRYNYSHNGYENNKDNPVIIERGPAIPEHISVRKQEEHAEVMKRGDDFKVPFFRNIGNTVGNTVGCLISIIIVIIFLVIIGLIIF